MRWKSLCHSKFAAVGLAAVFLTGTAAASPMAATAAEPVSASASWGFQSEATGLLGEVKALAYKLDANADTLAAAARSGRLSAQTHAWYLTSARDNINAIGERLDRLQKIKHVAAPWQQKAIDRIVPISAKLVGHTEAAINHVNNNRQQLFADSYRRNVAAIADHASDLKRTVGQFIDYGQTQQKMERLQQQLEIASL